MQSDNAPQKSATAFAQSGTKNTIPEASQIGVAPGAASFTDGFPPLTMTPIAAGGVPPSGQDFNGILHFLSNAVRWNQSGAGYPFDAVFAAAIGGYPKGAVVRSNDGLTLWASQIDHNTTDPNGGASGHWQNIKTRWPTWEEVSGKPDSFGPRICSITALPTTNIGPVIVAEASEVWIWVQTPYFTGYRSPLCGRPVDGHTASPLANEIDAAGGILSKAAYPGLWAYAQENNLVISQSVWADNIGGHYFADISNTQLRVPDLRNQFRRYTGTDADNAYARTLGSLQADAFKSHTHALSAGPNALQTSATPDFNDVGRPGVTNTGCETQPAGGAETRGRNTAFHPRIHI